MSRQLVKAFRLKFAALWSVRSLRATRLIYLSAFCLFCCLLLAVLVSPGQTIKTGPMKSPPNLPNEQQKMQLNRKVLAAAFDMLRARGVPFDPELLADKDWRSQLD